MYISLWPQMYFQVFLFSFLSLQLWSLIYREAACLFSVDYMWSAGGAIDLLALNEQSFIACISYS